MLNYLSVLVLDQCRGHQYRTTFHFSQNRCQVRLYQLFQHNWMERWHGLDAWTASVSSEYDWVSTP